MALRQESTGLASSRFKRFAATALWAAADFVMPPQCGGCGGRLDVAGHLCARCWRDIAFIEPPLCDRSGVPFAFDPGPGAVSPAVIADPPVFDRARAVATYEGAARNLVRALKYADRHEVAELMARLMWRAGGELLAEADVLVPVPLHRGRLWRRRFNQSALLAARLTALTGVPTASDALIRVRPTRQQVGLSADQRRRNVAGAFRAGTAAGDFVAGKRVVVIDDVLTTGATANAAARALKRAGAVSVAMLVFARVADVVETPI